MDNDLKHSNSNIYFLIDVLKLFFCICIIGIHTEIFSNINADLNWYVVHCVFRIAVPFFFAVAGFFYGSKIMKNKDKIFEITKSYLTRLFIPFLF